MSKRKRAARAERKHKNQLQVLEGGSEKENHNPLRKKRQKQVTIVPRNANQKYLMHSLKDDKTHIAFAIGPAGTGKTLLSTLYAIHCLKTNQAEKIIITRPAVSVDEQHGFLPGSLNDKMSPWTKPIFDIFEDYYSPKHIEYMLEENIIEIAPLAYMRGRTFKSSIVIADEMQNATESQMKMLLTRIGEGSKLIVTGDLDQHDRGYESNGLKEFVDKLSYVNSEMIDIVEFGKYDIERHPAVSEVLRIYDNTAVPDMAVTSEHWRTSV